MAKISTATRRIAKTKSTDYPTAGGGVAYNKSGMNKVRRFADKAMVEDGLAEIERNKADEMAEALEAQIKADLAAESEAAWEFDFTSDCDCPLCSPELYNEAA